MKRKLLIAGGGTGGHLFPGIAVAEEWVSRGGDVLFAGSTRGLERDIIPRYGYPLYLLSASKLKGGGILRKIKTLIKLPRIFFEAFLLLKKVKPDVVLGIGGYVSGPLLFLARIMQMKTSIIEQNIYPGLTNRWLGRWVHRIFITYDETSAFFKKKKVRAFGNPTMKKIRDFSLKLKSVERQAENYPTLLVCGGSQGAHVLNEVFIKSLNQLQRHFPQIFVYHQTGEKDYKEVEGAFKKENIKGQTAPFFFDMEKKYAEADLVVSRAGAGILTELALWGLPSILIPYPHAADDHQRKNAEYFATRGASLIILESELTSTLLVRQIIPLLSDQQALSSMSEKARQIGKPDAAQKIVDELLLFPCTKNIESIL